MKKILTGFIILLTILFLNSCTSEIDRYQLVYNELVENLNLTADNFIDSDFLLPQKSKLEENAFLSYNSDNPNVLKINDYQAVVIRKEQDVEVNLIIRITLDNETKVYELLLTIQKNDLKSNYFNVKYLNDKKTYQIIKHQKGDLLILPNNPKKDNHVFMGWELDGEYLPKDFKVNENITLNAVYNNLENRITINTKELICQLNDGLSYIEIDLSNNSEIVGNIEVVVDDVLIDIIDVNKETLIYQTYNLYGKVTIEFKPTNNLLISNIKMVNNNIKDNLQDDISSLDLDKEFNKKSKIVLPEKGIRGSVFTWSLKNQNDSIYLDIEKLEVNPPKDFLVEVLLILKSSLFEVETNLEIKISLGLPKIITLRELDDLENGQRFRTEAQVVSMYKIENITYYLIKDENNRTVIESSIKSNIKIDDIVIFTGVVSDDSVSFNEFKVLDKGLKDNVNLLLNTSELEKNLYKKVYLEGISVSNITNNEFDIYLDDKIKVINMGSEYIDIKKGQYIEITGYVTKMKNTYVVYFSDLNDINSTSISDNHIVNIIMKDIMLNELIKYNINADFPLVKTDKIFNSELVWESEHPEYLSNEGKYNSPKQKTESTLTLTIKLEGKIIGSKKIKVIINPT